MIGKPEWFTRRKYGGWGLHPKTWQGWVYIAVMVVPIVLFQMLPYWTNEMRTYVTIGWLGFFLFDVFHIMIKLRKDERESRLEAYSDRNAAWTMMIVLVVGLMYQSIMSGIKQEMMLDWFLFAALIGGALAKTASEIYLSRKGA